MPAVDLWVIDHLYRGPHSHAWLFTMLAATVVGSGWSLVALIPFLHAKQTRRVASILLACVLASASVVFVVKHLVGRSRPCTCVQGVTAIVVEAPTDPSFPSGHAAGAFTVATFVALAHVRRARSAWSGGAVVLGCAGAATLIAVSRVALGVHFTTDVACGALIGVASGALGVRHSARDLSENKG